MEKRKKGSLITMHRDGHFKPDLQIQESLEFDAFTGDGCPILYINQKERVWGTRPWWQFIERTKYAWTILRRGIGINGDLGLSPKECNKLGKKLIEIGRWLEKNKWNGEKPRHWRCTDCGSRKVTYK